MSVKATSRFYALSVGNKQVMAELINPCRTCNKAEGTDELHACPFDCDIKGECDPKCNCCEDCENNCEREI